MQLSMIATEPQSNATFTQLASVRRQVPPRELRRVHDEALAAAAGLKNAESQMIKVLQKVDRFLVHRELGYGSLWRYCVEALHLTEAQSQALITVARKAALLPALQTALDSGEISASKASRITSVINEQNQRSWIDLAKGSTKRELERAVAKANPRLAVPERVRFANAHVLEMQVPVSEADYDKLVRVRELLTQSRGHGVSLSETITTLAEEYLTHHATRPRRTGCA